jgi:hypothetical protein
MAEGETEETVAAREKIHLTAAEWDVEASNKKIKKGPFARV